MGWEHMSPCQGTALMPQGQMALTAAPSHVGALWLPCEHSQGSETSCFSRYVLRELRCSYGTARNPRTEIRQ